LELAQRSPDLKLKYGAVLVADAGEVIGEGANHPAPGYRCEDCPRVKDRSIKSGTQLERCFAIHAEQEALMDAWRANRPRIDRQLTMYVLGMHPDGTPLLLDEALFSCSICSRIMAAAGVRYVCVATKSGAATLTIAKALETSFRVAEGAARAY
jgi:deoxycytidylate deaminase